MRKMLWFTLGFGAACGLCAYLLIPELLTLPLIAAGAVLLLVFRHQTTIRRLGLMLLGISAGIFWFMQYRNQYLEPVYQMDGTVRSAEIRCTDFGERTDYGLRVPGTVVIQNKQYQTFVYLEEDIKPEPGTTLSGKFDFRVTAPGGQRDSSYFQGEGVFLLAYQKEELTVSVAEYSWKDLPALWRHKFLNVLDANLPDDAFSFAKALMLGDTSGLDYGILTDLTVSGIRHIVAVSGLHVSILFTLLGFITFRKRFLSALLGLPVLVVFAALTGFSPSVSRACIMLGLMLLAALLNREYDGPSALAFAGLVLLITNPLVITSVSYQLSFASVAGIFACSPVIRNCLFSAWKPKSISGIWRKAVNGVIVSVSVTMGATVASVPLCAFYFGTVSLASAVTNLLVLWAVSVIFYGLLAMCLVSSFWAGGSVLLGKAVTFLIRYVLMTAKIIADFPLASVYTESPYITAWLIFVYILLAAFLVMRNRKPVVLGCCIGLSLCCALLASWSEPLGSEVRFTVLDVGQGQCLLIQTEGRNCMVDCGGSSDSLAADKAAQMLLSQGISSLDCVILTHYDADHAGGLENLLSRVDAKLLILPPVYSELHPEAGQILYPEKDLTLTLNKSKIHIYTSKDAGSDNENSLCILFDSENCDILITSDRSGVGERLLLRRAAIEDVDILIAGHHGAKDSACDELLRAVSPEIVCISVGEGNRFGHPAPELLQRLASYGCSVYRTDLQGDILIRR